MHASGGGEDKGVILIVDDRPANLVALEAILEPLGETIVRAASGRDAVRAAAEREVALCLMDVRMPQMNGLEAAGLIRQQPRHRDLPIVFVTASDAEADEVQAAYAQGAVEYLRKPLDADVVRAKVAVFLRVHRRHTTERRRAVLLDEQRQAAERRAQARPRQVLDAIPHVVFAADAKGAIYYCNRRWREYTGLDVAGGAVDWTEIVHPDERAAARAFWRGALTDHKPVEAEWRIMRSSDRSYRVNLCRAVPEDGGEEGSSDSGWVMTATDVHERVDATNRLAEALRAKEEFVATVSHELRTPVNTMVGSLRLLRTESPVSPRWTSALDALDRSTAAHVDVLESLLGRSRALPSGLPPVTMAKPLTGLTLLLVDDDDDVREMLTFFLEDEGAAVQQAATVEAALALFGANPFDLVVSDIGMPGHDGYELIARIRALPADAGGRTPAVALTGYAQPRDANRALGAGFDAHISKPIDPDVLPRMLRQVVDRARNR